jgi:hypothetical protein
VSKATGPGGTEERPTGPIGVAAAYPIGAGIPYTSRIGQLELEGRRRAVVPEEEGERDKAPRLVGASWSSVMTMIPTRLVAAVLSVPLNNDAWAKDNRPLVNTSRV